MTDQNNKQPEQTPQNLQGAPSSQPAPAAQPVYGAASAPKKTSGMAVAALVLGLIALLNSFIPLLNFLSTPLAIIGLVLALIGFTGILRGKAAGKGLAIAAIILNVLALLIFVAMYSGGGSGSVSKAASSASSAPAVASASTSKPSNGTSSSATSGSSAASAASTAASADTVSSAASTSAKGSNSKYEVSIDDARLAQDYEGKSAVVITMSWVNNSDKETSFLVALNPSVYQNGVELSSAILLDGIDSDAMLKDVKPGAGNTVEYAYLLDDESPVTVEVKQLISLSNTILAERTFEL